MSNSKPKHYVVWYGHEPGVYGSWEECKAQTERFKGAKYKSYPTREQADEAFVLGPEDERPENVCTQRNETGNKHAADAKAAEANNNPPALPPEAVRDAVAVDAACSGNPGQMEYRGIYLKTGKLLFHFGPRYGTNNIGEFLAIVHALALIKQCGAKTAIYSDSRNAMLWVKGKKCKTTLARNAKTEELFNLIGRAEKWLRENTYNTPILKWNTAKWGEIPADFGRKH